MWQPPTWSSVQIFRHLIPGQLEDYSFCERQSGCKNLVYKNANPYVLSCAHLKEILKVNFQVVCSLSFLRKIIAFKNCIYQSNASLHFCSWRKGIAGFVSFFSFPFCFVFQKRKAKLSSFFVPLKKNYSSVTASSGCWFFSVSLIKKSVYWSRLKQKVPQEGVKLDCLAVILLAYQ